MEYLDKDAKLAKEKELLNRWDWLTEGLGYNEKLDTSIILENSYDKMVIEGQLPRGWLEANVLNEEEEVLTEAPMHASAVGSNVLPKIMFPIIRRVFPELIANKIVSVQPLTQPTGIIYYILYQYSNTKGNITATNEYSGNPMQTSPAYAVYYSSEKIGPFEVTMGAGNTSVSTGSSVTGFLGVDTSAFSLKRIEVYSKTTMTAISTTLSTDMSTDNTYSGVTNVQYTADDGTIYLKSALAAEGTPLVVYLVYDQEGSSKIPEMEFSISSMNVTTTERKMKVRWTKESEQDMQAYHKIDVESELVKVASMQMNYEIDREIISFIGDRVISDLSFLHDWTNDAAGSGNNTAGNYLDRHRALAQKIYMAQAKIAQFNRLGGATWAVTSPQIAALLQSLPDWKGEIANVGATINSGGFLGGGKLQVFVDPNRYGAAANEILLGYKSEQTVYGAGVVYSPYTSWMSNVITHPENFDSIRGFFSRYALTMVLRGQYNYAKINILNYGV